VRTTEHAPADRARVLVDAVVGADDPRASAREYGDELVAVLLREHWLRLAALLRDSPDDRLPGWFAWRAAYALHHLGHLGDADRIASAAAAPESGSPDDHADTARVLAVAAAVAWNRGDAQRCRELIELAGGHDERSGGGAEGPLEVARGLLAAVDGKRDANLRHYRNAQAWAERTGDLLTQERVLNNLASRALESGDPVAAVDLAQRGLGVNELTGHHSGRAILRQNLAEALIALGRLDEALEEAHQARELYSLIGSPNAGAAWQLVADVQARRGQPAQAEAAYRQAIAAAETEGDAQTLVPSLAGLALVLVADDPAGAREVIERLEAQPTVIGNPLTRLAAGWVHLHSGDIAVAREHARAARAEAGRVEDLPRLAEALELEALADDAPGSDHRFREAAGIRDEHPDPIQRGISQYVVAARSRDEFGRRLAAQALHAHGLLQDAWRIGGPLLAVGADGVEVPLRVHTLGNFVLYRAGVPVAAEEWRSRKAMEALRVLAGHTDRGLAREELGEILWPGVDDVSNRLSVALSHLRAVLDPERAHPQDHFLRIERGRMQLNLEHISVDVAEFRAAAQGALAALTGDRDRAIAMLETAAALHTGQFAEGESAAWSDDIRDETEQIAQDLNRALATLLRKGTEPETAVPWLSRLLATDPYDEPGHLAMIEILDAAGRFGESARARRRYVARMRELGVTPTGA